MRHFRVLVVLAVMLITAAGFAQPTPKPLEVWRRNFTFGGQFDAPADMLFTTSGVYVNGHFEGDVLRGALSSFALDGTQQRWTLLDTTNTWSFSGHLAAIPADNAVVWYSGTVTGYNPSWIIKISSTRQEVWRIPVNRLMYMGNYTDTSFVAILSGSNPIAFVYNRHGVVTRQFPLMGSMEEFFVLSTFLDHPMTFSYNGYAVHQSPVSGEVIEGIVSIRTRGNFLWIGFHFPGGIVSSASYAVEKYDIPTGQRLWRREFVDLVLGQMDLDGEVAYAGGTKLVNEDGGVTKFALTRIESDGGLTWQREWFLREPFNANYDNFSQTVSVVGSENSEQVLLGGSIERSDTGNTSRKNAYLVGRKATNGDPVWVMEDSTGNIASFRSVLGREDGSFYLVEDVYVNVPTGKYGVLSKFLAPTLSAKEVGGLPESFQLSQNYPNPFNPSTTIRFELLVRSPVRLTVYDALGRQVATLVNETLEPKVYETVWNAVGTASGVYLYRLTTGGFVQTKKMILLK